MSNGSHNSSKPLATAADQPANNRRWPHPIMAGLIIVLLFFAGQIMAAYAVQAIGLLAGGSAGPPPTGLFADKTLLQFGYILLAEGLMLACLVWLFRKRGISRRDIGLTRPRWKDLAYGAGSFIVYISAYVMLLQVVRLLIPGFDANQRQDIGFGDASGLVPLLLVFFALVVLAPVTEEILLRGFFFGSLRRRYRFIIAAIPTSLLFAALHLGGGEQGAGLLWVAAIDTFVLSMVLCYLREKTGRLWASILLHAIKNGIAFTALFILTGNR